VKVEAVRGRRNRALFVRFPWQIYRGDAAWVPPLRSSVRALLDDERHPFYDGGRGAEIDWGFGLKEAFSRRAFWQITSEAGIPSSVIRWPLTLPPEEVKGVMLSGLGVPDLKATLGRYTLYTTREVSPDEKTRRKGDVVKVPRDLSAFETVLHGPERSRVKLRVTLNREDRTVTLGIGDGDHVVGEGQWSDWIRARFRVKFHELRELRTAPKVHLSGNLAPSLATGVE